MEQNTLIEPKELNINTLAQLVCSTPKIEKEDPDSTSSESIKKSNNILENSFDKANLLDSGLLTHLKSFLCETDSDSNNIPNPSHEGIRCILESDSKVLSDILIAKFNTNLDKLFSSMLSFIVRNNFEINTISSENDKVRLLKLVKKFLSSESILSEHNHENDLIRGGFSMFYVSNTHTNIKSLSESKLDSDQLLAVSSISHLLRNRNGMFYLDFLQSNDLLDLTKILFSNHKNLYHYFFDSSDYVAIKSQLEYCLLNDDKESDQDILDKSSQALDISHICDDEIIIIQAKGVLTSKNSLPYFFGEISNIISSTSSTSIIFDFLGIDIDNNLDNFILFLGHITFLLNEQKYYSFRIVVPKTLKMAIDEVPYFPEGSISMYTEINSNVKEAAISLSKNQKVVNINEAGIMKYEKELLIQKMAQFEI